MHNIQCIFQNANSNGRLQSFCMFSLFSSEDVRAARNIFYGYTLYEFGKELIEDVYFETPGCRHGVLGVGDISMARDLRARTPIRASRISMKSLNEDKNDSVDNTALKPEEKKTLRGKTCTKT